MSVVPEQFRLELKPVAAHQAVVRVRNVRFTILTDRLIRLEHESDGCFEDRATQTVWYREQPVPAFVIKTHETGIEIETDYLHLRYIDLNGGAFTPETLSIHVKSVGAVWHPGDVDEHNLKGTTRTLDFVNGYTPLTDGLMSRSGWSLLDDSNTLVFKDDGWIEPRTHRGVDWYFFGYGHDYKACLQDYCKVSGDMPMIPRWILGNWWSRYWAYTQEELTQLIHDFEAHQIPLSVCIVDMDWHITKTNNKSTGWTGYTWNRDLFPDPEGFIKFLHDKGLKTGLNLHPAEGIHPHEAAYPDMARRVGVDPTTGEAIAFDITDPAFVRAYFELLHHPYEAMGVDFWWVDWQQGQKCRIDGLDPLWLINHLHFHDLGRDQTRRPFIFSRWGDQGHQRYPIGFSGDSYMTWDTLRFEAYMTPTASNIAYGWWSHDIGGHTSGDGDSELFTRWVQFGVLSPIMRIHTTKGAFYDQRPWMVGNGNAEVTKVLRDALQLRHALIPYLYTMAARAHRESLPLMLPMYYEYPKDEAAYHCPQQYLFGSELIAAPFVHPADADTGLARQVVWLPEGDWYHFFTGEYFAGERWQAVYGTLKDIPLFAKAGAIVPMHDPLTGNANDLHIHLFAGADNTFTLYEDDGESRGYLAGKFAQTTLTQKWHGDRLDFTMNAAQGDTDLIPKTRTIHLHIHGIMDSGFELTTSVDGAAVSADATYDADTETLHLSAIEIAPTSSLVMKLATNETSLLARRDRGRENTLEMLRAFRLNNGVRNRLAASIDAILSDPDQIAPYLITMTDAQQRALFEMLYGAGVHYVADAHQPTLIVLWNNGEDTTITYRYSDAYLFFGMVKSAHHHNGVVPRFKVVTPKIETWRHGANGEHVQQTQWLVQVDYRNLVTVSEGHRERTP